MLLQRCSVFVLLFLSGVSLAPTYGHSGRTDSKGGHHDRKNGGYHYHNGGSSVRPPATPQFIPLQPRTQLPRPRTQKVEQPPKETKVRPVQPKGRRWIDQDGHRIANGDPKSFDRNTGNITIDDGIHPTEAITLGRLSVLDQAFILDNFRSTSKYNKHQLEWVSKGGTHHVMATPLVVDQTTIHLHKAGGRLIKVPIDSLDESSQQLAKELREAGELADKLIQSIEQNPFSGGQLVGTGAASQSPATSVDSNRLALLDAQSATHTGKVVSITDGDTLQLRTADETIKIRLVGIDAPEKSQAFGMAAKKRLSELTFGKQASVIVISKDLYGRSLGVVVVDGVDANLQIVRDGLAWHYKAYSKDKSLAAAELAARKERLGIWSDSATPIPPWDFRRLPKRTGAARSTPPSHLSSSSTKANAELSHWLNTPSNTRHNSSCRWHANTKQGRKCTADEGKACGICGG